MAAEPERTQGLLAEEVKAANAVTVLSVNPDDRDEFQRLAFELTGVLEESVLVPLRRVLEVARAGGCRTVVIEEQYSDADYRSEYSLFWSRRHEERSPRSRRLHFFAETVTLDDVHQVSPAALANYLGYSVLRPTRLGPVGRTVLRPPPDMRDANLCKVSERPSLFGVELPVEGVPFTQQDGELLRCAHAVAWLCHYVAWSRQVVARRLTADIASMPMADRSKHRPLPSHGLTAEQLQGIFSAMGLPAFFYDVGDLPEPPSPLERPPAPEEKLLKRNKQVEAERAIQEQEYKLELEREQRLRIACKYLNAGFPVVVFAKGAEESHTFTLVGWRHTEDGVQLIACDDQVGPYEPIDDVMLIDAIRGEWTALMIPLPERVHLNGEAAETRARDLVRGAAQLERESVERGQGSEDQQGADFNEFASKLSHLRKGVSIRSRLVRGRDLKAALVDQQGRTGDALRLYRLARLPNWVWLVEFQDSEARRRGEPCVLAEIIFDSTSHDLLPVTSLTATLNESKDNAVFRAAGPGPAALAPGPNAGKPWPSLINPPLAAPEMSQDAGEDLGAGQAV
jgi:hypothetical protein